MILQRKLRIFPLRLKSALRALDLPINARWEQAAPVLKRKIVESRKSENIEQASFWSEVKAFLILRLNRSCSVCGCAIKPEHRRCNVHVRNSLQKS